ncbi:NACHT domain-containing protein [Chromobacterium phragmitis]|uniref:NACHT domain-containing protein n=1 Tax=Chromobacterium phragmitis TaxID=2202141 RepID=A0ABV0IQU4_9NEIS
MADKMEGASLGEAGLSIFKMLWEWTSTSETWRIVIVVFLLVVLLIWAMTACLGALGKALEGAVKLIDTFKASGFPRFMAREDRIKIRRRAQFCTVLEADLTSIAKAESWNDQYFTDLEAEVETEGGYYISPLHRFLGKVSTGLRKEKSLIKAISSSSERAIQLTGEPGSGKSVALRHLASQLAVRAKTSKAKEVLVPLYVNLREITVPSGLPITADTIRDFILDNIRRGDSDTTAYVRENWADYRERGIWFFLFDSFDEIPAVLHAEKGNPATKEYAEAIRMFLEGMGECRGILASREFKGPESLPWKKFRILRLSPRKQQELVANAFLTQVQERAVLHHLAANESTLANTPLFLTLLCRYVKEASTAPKNDYELLSLQIDRLARRDPTYLQRTYGLTPAELLEGAERIARLFAEESSLGLAPTIDQVEMILAKDDVPGGDIQRFVAAMVDSKIARADVPNAAAGDRRFAFAHRRYQEALFVRHLVTHPGYLSGYDLLTDPRWREYAVTLLETQPVEALNEMFQAAAHLLAEATASQYRRNALDPLNNYCGYFEWISEATQTLNLLQEGLVRRVSVIPEALSAQAAQFLKVRWEAGDSFDRMMVMRVAALLPQTTLSQYLEETFSNGSDKAQNEGFNQTVSLIGKTPSAVRQAVLNRLSDEILGAKDSSALLRVEALIARLPRDIGAEHVHRRCLLLWRLTKIVNTTVSLSWPNALDGVVRKLLNRLVMTKDVASIRTFFAMVVSGAVISNLPLLLFISLFDKHGVAKLSRNFKVLWFGGPDELFTWMRKGEWVGLTVVICSILISMIFPVIFRFRMIGESLSIRFFVRRFGSLKGVLDTIKLITVTLLGMSILWVGIYFLGGGVSFVASHVFGLVLSAPNMILGIGALVVLSFGLFLAMLIFSVRRRRVSLRLFTEQLDKAPDNPIRVLLSAQDWRQFGAWLSYWGESIHAGMANRNVDEQMRSLSAALQHVQRGGVLPKTVVAFMDVKPSTHRLAGYITDIEWMRDRFLLEANTGDSIADKQETVVAT